MEQGAQGQDHGLSLGAHRSLLSLGRCCTSAPVRCMTARWSPSSSARCWRERRTRRRRKCTCPIQSGGCSSAMTPRARPTAGNRRPRKSFWNPPRASRSSGLARRTQRERSATGTRTPVSAVLTSFLFLQGDRRRGEGLGHSISGATRSRIRNFFFALVWQFLFGVCVLPVEFWGCRSDSEFMYIRQSFFGKVDLASDRLLFGV